MDDPGYIWLHRALLTSKLWSLPSDEQRFATYLLLEARQSFEPKKLPHVTIKRGEIVRSLGQMAKACEWYENRSIRAWSKQKVSRMIVALANIGFLDDISDTYGTHLRICNYARYQRRQYDNSDGNSDEPGRHRNDTRPIQEREEGQEEEKKKMMESAGEDQPSLFGEPDKTTTPVDPPEKLSKDYLERLELVENGMEPIASLPLKGGLLYHVFQQDLDEWAPIYRNVSNRTTLLQIQQWCKNNEAKRKTTRGARAFITNWLQRAQDDVDKVRINPHRR